MKASLRLRFDSLLLAIDLIGTALFAAEGAATAMGAHLDILGVLTLAFITAIGGGLIRDVLLGAVPPSSIRDWRYAGCSLAAGALVFAFHFSSAGRHDGILIALDAAGLSFFAVAGATKALEYGLHPLLAVLMGGITGVGGGTIRDIIINRIPRVLQSDVYASAALLGSLTTVLLLKAKLRPLLANLSGILLCFATRMLAVTHGWNLPISH